MKKMIIKNPNGFIAKDFNSDPVGRKFVKITYGKRSRLGRFLNIRKTKIVKIPKNTKVMLIENNSPKIGLVSITLKKTN